MASRNPPEIPARLRRAVLASRYEASGAVARMGRRSPGVDALLAGMANEASAIVAKGAFDQPTVQHRLAFMRYVGQGHEISVALPPRDFWSMACSTGW
jgi:hypothetical protein